MIYKRSNEGCSEKGGGYKFYPLKLSDREVLELVSENAPHTYTHTHAARIEYERTAAALGCIPAVLHQRFLQQAGTHCPSWKKPD